MPITRIQRMLAESNLFHQVAKTAAYSMSVADFVVNCNTAGGAFTVTLPSVAEAKGNTYKIHLTGGAVAGAAPAALTVIPRGGDGKTQARFQLLRPGQYVVFYSDGESWNLVGAKGNSVGIGQKYLHTMFRAPMIATGLARVNTPSGAAGVVNGLLLGDGRFLEYACCGTQTLTTPAWADPGLELGTMDQTATDGIEIVGATTTTGLYAFTVGTDPAFFARARITISDVSGLGITGFGFRKVEAFQADPESYNDFAYFNITTHATAAPIDLWTSLAAAATVKTVSTQTWADTATHTLEVRVSSLGVVTYLIDDAAPTVTAAFSFAAATVLTPFLIFIQNTDICDSFKVLELEWGYQ